MDDIWKPPGLILGHPTLFTGDELTRYEREILANPNATEHDASRFFKRFPKFLFLGQGKAVQREVVITSDENSSAYRVDFFRQSYGSAFWDIIELKSPKKSFISGAHSGHPKLSSDVTGAISQAEDYRELIIEDASIRAQLLRKGILVCRPQILVVVGKSGEEVSPERMQALYDRARRGPIEAKSYQDIFNFAKEHYEASNLIVFFAQQGIDRDELGRDVIVIRKVEEFLEQRVSPNARFPFSGGPIRVKVDGFNPETGNLHVDFGACRYVEGMQLNQELDRLIREAVPEVSNVSGGFREL